MGNLWLDRLGAGLGLSLLAFIASELFRIRHMLQWRNEQLLEQIYPDDDWMKDRK